MYRVHIEQDFSRPVEEIFAHLAAHENLEAVFGAKIKRVKDGDDGHLNGVGSVRALRVGPPPWFEETVTEFVPNELIRYRITKGSPLKDHEGVMRFSPTASGGTHLDYTITFDAKVPGLGAVVKAGLDRNIGKGLKKLA
jgi:uncharacterized protein YndB with AHSA1/START domain